MGFMRPITARGLGKRRGAGGEGIPAWQAAKPPESRETPPAVVRPCR